MISRSLRRRAVSGILVAAFAAFILSVSLWFVGSHDQGIFVGLWVPSILAFGILALKFAEDPRE